MRRSKPIRPGGGWRVFLMLVFVLALPAVWYGLGHPDRRQAVIYGFENWVSGLQGRFGIRPYGAPSAAEVELLKPPAALRSGSPQANAPRAAGAAAGSDPAIQDDEALLSGTQPQPTLAAQPLKLKAGDEAPLALQLLPGLDARGLRVIIGGLPMDASLSAGARDEMGRWVLDAGALAGLRLRSGAAGHFTLLARTQSVQRERVPRPHAETPLEVTVLPAAARPVAPVAPATTAGPAQPAPDELLERGRRALELGDLGAARLYLEAAAGQNNADAALLLAASYDPSRPGIGDGTEVERAADWYLRARKLGAADAEPAITALRAWLQARTAPDEAQRKALARLTEAQQSH